MATQPDGRLSARNSVDLSLRQGRGQFNLAQTTDYYSSFGGDGLPQKQFKTNRLVKNSNNTLRLLRYIGT